MLPRQGFTLSVKFSKQPRVLDGDDGLGGKSGHKLDLLFCKGPHFPTPNSGSARQSRVMQKRDGQDSAGLFVLENQG
jgi:hypothetical protein